MQHNKNNPLVSIITLTFNKFHYLFETLESAKIQDYPYIELIISDDGSLDFPEKEVNEFIKTLPENFVNVIVNQNSNNLGIVKNFNHAIGLSKGDIIVPLSCDDLFYDNHSLSHIVNFFETNPEFLIATGKREVYDELFTKKLAIFPNDSDSNFLRSSPAILFNRLVTKNFISGACTPFKKDLISNYGNFDERYFLIEDYPRYLSLTRQGEMIGYIEKILIKYRDGGISSKINTRYNRDKIQIIKTEILPFKQLIEYKIYKTKKNELLVLEYVGIQKTTPKIIFIIFHPLFIFKYYLFKIKRKLKKWFTL